MASECVIVWDCGATNVRAVAIDAAGRILAAAPRSNDPVAQDSCDPSWRIWDIDRLYNDLCELTGKVIAELGDNTSVRAVTITTWGADGTVVDADGTPLHPLICWQCPRTEPQADQVRQNPGAETLFTRTGYQIISFNTLLRLMWLRQNAPDALDKAHTFMFTPGLLSHRLTGQCSVDPTMAGTSMAFKVTTRVWDNDLLALADVDTSLFPDLVEPGQVIGQLTADAATRTGMPAGVPVVAAGHDTQFALYGSGASLDQAVLSSGTWEVLLLRTPVFSPDAGALTAGIIIEQDAVAGRLNPQFLMMGSGVLEWIRDHFYSQHANADNIYDIMVGDARTIHPGCDGVTLVPSFVAGTGPAKPYNTPGMMQGLQLGTGAAHIYRAGLEGLTFQLRHALDAFKESVNFTADGVCVVGGGSKNPLWNQIRADVTNLPVTVTDHKEATVLGASRFAFVGAGMFDTVDQACEAVQITRTVIEPSADRAVYDELFERYMTAVTKCGQ